MKALLVCVALLLSACQLSTPQPDYDTSQRFSQYQRFTWHNPAFRYEGAAQPRQDDLLEARLKSAISTALQQKGLALAANAELSVQVGLSQRIEQQQLTTQIGGYWGASTLYQTRQYDYPMLVVSVDLIDQAEQRLIWRNTDEIPVVQSLSPQRRTEQITNLINKLFAQYPPH